MGPMYVGKIDESSQTAHHRMWFDLPVRVIRQPPELNINVPGTQELPGHYVPVTTSVNIPQPASVRDVVEQVQVPVVQAPAPPPVCAQAAPVVQAAPTCTTGSCAAAAPVV